MQRILYTLLIFFGLVTIEALFIGISTGYPRIQFKSPLLENIGFFVQLAGDDPLATLRIVLMDNPVFILQSKHGATDSTVWSLHYFSLTVLAHLLVAFILSEKTGRQGIRTRLQAIPVTGAVLLLGASVYLLLAGCCTDGPHWLFHTWLLAVVFNPITSGNATIQLYQVLKDWFLLPQLVMGTLGVYLLYRHQRRYRRGSSAAKINSM